MVHRTILAPLGVGILYWAAAAMSLALTNGADGVATMWPASGILFAALIVLPARLRWPCLGFAAIGSVIANAMAGLTAATVIGFTIANMAEALVASALLRHWSPHRPSFIVPRDVLAFTAASVIAALWSATIAWIAAGQPGELFLPSWFVTVTLGMLIVTPTALLMLALVNPQSRAAVCQGSARRAAGLLTMVFAVTLAVFAQNSYPLLFLPLVALLAATYGLGPVGAASGVAIIAIVAPLMTGMGRGPLGLMLQSRIEMSFFLQFYLVVLFATALPLAALLAARDRLGRQCADSERLHRLLADTSSDVIVRFSNDGHPVYISPAVIRILDMTPAEVIAAPVMEPIHPDDREMVRANWLRLLTGDPNASLVVYRHRRRDGSYVWLEAAYRIVDAAPGTPAEVIASIRDVDARHRAELDAVRAVKRMQETNRLLALAERAAGVGHWRLGVADGTLFWSPEVFRIHGIAENEMPTAEDAIRFYLPEERPRIGSLVGQSMALRVGFDFEGRIVRPGGEVRHIISRGQPEFDPDGVFIGLFGIFQDVTLQVIAGRELEAAKRAAEDAAAQALRLVDIDALTGVSSRRKAMAALDEAIVDSRAAGLPLAVAIFDIDHFKGVNDRYGHAAGDAVLRRVARVAKEAVRPTDLVGRLGGEEFLVLLPGAPAANAVAIAEQLRTAVAASGGGVEVGPRVTVSVGVALLSEDASAASLLGDADRALYRAKAAGRNAARLAA
ncbi:diguanylate cyclase [Microvirga sp. SRT01]|uniref:diguanylate cyclase n=1 Tax=Sphingomonas longa TaxID=2778730 RepID=A0ABS2D925_9SPHN|nr:diguanylate cyclase [Microvirga sp. SRT01]MBM6577432.1 diguanylate cyclase [Sphingomonas sp. BT552]MBR7710477.1 diguanylate cyclase [Microvirga sp. SRT01]